MTLYLKARGMRRLKAGSASARLRDDPDFLQFTWLDGHYVSARIALRKHARHDEIIGEMKASRRCRTRGGETWMLDWQYGTHGKAGEHSAARCA